MLFRRWRFIWLVLLFILGCNNQSGHSDHDGMEQMDRSAQVMKDEEVKNGDSASLRAIALPANYSVISSQRTVRPVLSGRNSGIAVNGFISIDERRDSKVSARFSGRVEKMHVKYNFQYVKKGEKVMEIYSPELNTAQEEFLFLLKSGSEGNLVKKAKERLRLMGISDGQLNEMERNGSVLNVVSVLCPYDGYVYFENTPSVQIALPVKDNGMAMPDRSMPKELGLNSAIQIREGAYVNGGQTLFKVNDLNEVYGVVLIDNRHASEISEGTSIDLTSELGGDTIIRSKISLIEPVVRNGQKFMAARIYLENKGRLLKINSLFTAKIHPVHAKRLLIPNSSILFLGRSNIVWIKAGTAGEGKYIFQARDIITGSSSGNMTEVISGLTDKEEIALDAGYMLDRESLIQTR